MASSLVSLSNELAALVENFAAPVVAVHGRPRFNSSGVHWSPGVVATAEHTLRHDEDIFVTTGAGDRLPAEVAGRDPGTDLAVLRVKDLTFPTARPAEGSAPRPGNLIVLIGALTTLSAATPAAGYCCSGPHKGVSRCRISGTHPVCARCSWCRKTQLEASPAREHSCALGPRSHSETSHPSRYRSCSALPSGYYSRGFGSTALVFSVQRGWVLRSRPVNGQ
jgi:hypothetical protein